MSDFYDDDSLCDDKGNGKEEWIMKGLSSFSSSCTKNME